MLDGTRKDLTKILVFFWVCSVHFGRQTCKNGWAKQVHVYNKELPAIKHQIQTINDWIRLAAEKIGVDYKP
jgi:hypothetical protein